MAVEPDILDVAARVTTESAERTIRSISAAAAKLDTTNPTEHCLFCGEYVGVARRWCDSACRDFWSRHND